MSLDTSKNRKTGFYWVRLHPVISDAWEIAHWSQTLKNWQIHGKSNSYEENMMIEVDEVQLLREDSETLALIRQ